MAGEPEEGDVELIAEWEGADWPEDMMPDESLWDIACKASMQTLHSGLPWFDGSLDGDAAALRAGQLVEVVGRSGTGKTQLMLTVTANVLAAEPDATVVWLDCRLQFDVKRLAELLRQRVEGGGEAAVRSALARCRVFRLHSSLQLMVTLHAVVSLASSGELTPRLLIMDGVGAWFWQDKLCEPKEVGARWLYCVKALRRLLTSFAAVAMASKCTLFAGGDSEFMPRSWQQLVTHQLVLAPSPLHRTGDSVPACLTQRGSMIRGEGLVGRLEIAAEGAVLS
eukprot:PLAT12023.1.p1 GENE.PLAT12023.1~~PLAT12023.1.p1  ORF type:complete len:290 (-),score=66.52 PLAT12023.1:79-921(-)